MTATVHKLQVRFALHVVQSPSSVPTTRGDCLDGGSNAQRPCQHVTCRHHLLSDFPHATESCSLDVADRAEQTYQNLSEALGVSRARPEQIERQALKRPQVRRALVAFAEHAVGMARQSALSEAANDDAAPSLAHPSESARRYPGEREPMWLDLSSPRVTDEEYCQAIHGIYDAEVEGRRWRAPCPRKACMLEKGHEGRHSYPPDLRRGEKKGTKR